MAGRKASKSRGWYGKYDPTETRKQKQERIHATKMNAKRRKLRLRHVPAKEGPELLAERASKAKAAALKVFAAWLEKSAAAAAAAKERPVYGRGLVSYVRMALPDIVPPHLTEPTR